MNYVFEVIIHYKDDSRNVYNIIGKDDVSARLKALKTEMASYGAEKDISFEKFLEKIQFCEIRLNCRIDD
jgi:hypothetical protein